MTVPGTAGAVTAVKPTVEQCLDGDRYVVTLSLADQPDVLTLLARAVGRDAHVAHAWRTLMYTARSTGDPVRTTALADLLADQNVRDALTITLTPGDADDLADQLDRASCEPEWCANCDNCWATRSDHLCDGCGDAEDAHTTLDECAT